MIPGHRFGGRGFNCEVELPVQVCQQLPDLFPVGKYVRLYATLWSELDDVDTLTGALHLPF